MTIGFAAFYADPSARRCRECGSLHPGKEPPVRGHGGSGRRGDIDYIGQIDDDLDDFVTSLGPARPDQVRTLVGFSAGAGFTIRFAGGRYGELFDRYVFLSPTLPGAPTLRPNAGSWTNISIPRVVTIAALDSLGIHAFDGFDVISYAVSPANKEGLPAILIVCLQISALVVNLCGT